MYPSEIHICVFLWENGGTKKYILTLSLEGVSIAGYVTFFTHLLPPETVTSLF